MRDYGIINDMEKMSMDISEIRQELYQIVKISFF